MKHATKRQGNILILTLLEDLTFHNNDEFGSLLHQVVHDHNLDLIVDMTYVRTVDSMVAGHFVAAKRECDLKRRQFGLANVPDLARNVLHTGGADHQVHVYRSIEEAIVDLSDRSHGTQKRRLILGIKCGHDDCIYYTFGKHDRVVLPACEYPYQDDITNGPTCKCYKADWQQIQENLPLDGPSPFRNAKKKSLYEVRDRAAEKIVPVGDNFELDREFEDFEAPPPNTPVPGVAARLNDPNLKPKIATAIERTREIPVTPVEMRTVSEAVFSDDPFAVDNFPSSQVSQTHPHFPVSEPVFEEIKTPQSFVSPAPAPKPDPIPDPPPPPKPKIPADTPEQVVRKFVESWNHGDFQLEYRSLSARNRSFSESEYMTRRQSLRTSQIHQFGGRITTCEVARVDSCAIDGVHATVEITRVDRTPLGVKCYGQHYHMILEEGFWKIQRSEDGETRKNPVKPQKGRIMKAGDFQGKTKFH